MFKNTGMGNSCWMFKKQSNFLNVSLSNCLGVRETHNALQLPVFFFFSFFCESYKGLRNCKSVFPILKISQYGGSRQWAKFFQVLHAKIDIRIDISISIRSMTTKFGKQVHLEQLSQIRLIKQVLVTSSHQDQVTNWKHISTTTVPMATRLGKKATYLDGVLSIKSHDPLVTWSSVITWQTKIIISPLPHCLWK